MSERMTDLEALDTLVIAVTHSQQKERWARRVIKNAVQDFPGIAGYLHLVYASGVSFPITSRDAFAWKPWVERRLDSQPVRAMGELLFQMRCGRLDPYDAAREWCAMILRTPKHMRRISNRVLNRDLEWGISKEVVNLALGDANNDPIN